MGSELERALDVAARAIERRDRSARTLRERLGAAGVRPDDAERAIERLRQAGVVDDSRLARRRAAALAERGLGDEAIAARLAAEGIDVDARRAALSALEPEERRAVEIARLEAGRPPRTVAARLARRGFGEEAVETALAWLDAAGHWKVR